MTPLPHSGSLLLVRLRSIGDAVLMTALTAAIRRARPRLRIDALLEPPVATLLAGHPDLGRVITAERRLSGRLRAIAAVRAARYDVVVDLHGGPTAALLTALSGADRRIGLDAYRHRRAYSERLAAPWKQAAPSAALHTVESNLRLARALAVAETTGGARSEPTDTATDETAGSAADPAPRLVVSGTADERAAAVLAAAGAPSRAFIAVHPGAALASKTWPRARFDVVAERLLKEHPVVYLTPPATAPDEPPPGAATLPPLPLDVLLAVLARARLLVGNDSGPAHMAAAVGTPTVTVFGSQNPRVWRPWGERHRALWAGLECSPCAGFSCDQPRRFACLDEIAAEQVLTGARAVLADA